MHAYKMKHSSFTAVVICFLAVTLHPVSNEVIKFEQKMNNSPSVRKFSNILEVADNLGATMFVAFAKKAGLDKLYETLSPVTVIVPSNTAFNKTAYPELMQNLTTNVTFLREVLSYHTSRTVQLWRDVINDGTILSIGTGKPPIRFNVYLRPWMQTVVNTISGSRVKLFDQVANNGVLHVVDKVMYPLATHSIDDMSELNPDFFQLYELLQLSGFNVNQLTNGCAVTMFVPTNEAIRSLPPGAMYEFQHNPDVLISVLKHHMVNGTYYSSGLWNGQTLMTLNGDPINILIHNGQLKVYNPDVKAMVNVNSTDFTVNNGVIHTIDYVLMVQA